MVKCAKCPRAAIKDRVLCSKCRSRQRAYDISHRQEKLDYNAAHAKDRRANGAAYYQRNKLRIRRRQMLLPSEYGIWSQMIQRCTNPKHISFPYYGGRRIKVCERWLKSFRAFLEDVGARPSPKHSLDRWPDNDGDYRPGNIRWATAQQQVLNRRKSR